MQYIPPRVYVEQFTVIKFSKRISTNPSDQYSGLQTEEFELNIWNVGLKATSKRELKNKTANRKIRVYR